MCEVQKISPKHIQSTATETWEPSITHSEAHTSVNTRSSSSPSVNTAYLPKNGEWLPPLYRLFIAGGDWSNTQYKEWNGLPHRVVFHLPLLGGSAQDNPLNKCARNRCLDNWGYYGYVLQVGDVPQSWLWDGWWSITWYMCRAVSLWPVFWPVIMLQQHINWEKCQCRWRGPLLLFSSDGL